MLLFPGGFTMVNDTKISCYAVNGGQRGLTTEKIVTLAKGLYFSVFKLLLF